MTRVCSIFSQILQLITRLEFEFAARKHNAERHARGFTCWGQFVAMLFCQLGHAKSLREICGAWQLLKGNCVIWGYLQRLRVPRWPTPTSIALGRCTKRCFINCWRSARPWRPAVSARTADSALRTS
jgi:Domain of unknown function (DUF4372)